MKRAYYYIGAVVISALVIVLRWPRLEKNNLLKEIEDITTQREIVQEKINELALERTELTNKKIELMKDYFSLNYNINPDNNYWENYNNLFRWIITKEWTPYKLGWKGGWELDCSWLFGAYAYYVLKTINHNTLINHYSAESIRNINEETNIEDISIWDYLYLMKWWEAVHIAMIIDVDRQWKVTTFEAWVDRGVSQYEYNFIQDWNWIYILTENWTVYDFKITRNSLITSLDDRDDLELIWEFLISSYIPWNWDNINCWGGSCYHTASWLPLKDEYAWKIVACPKIYSIWLNWEPKQKLYIEWHWVVECSDRGWLIVMKWETNSRGNISSMNRLDLFAWLNTPKIKRSQTTRKVYLVE